jgi:hypothetical protein
VAFRGHTASLRQARCRVCSVIAPFKADHKHESFTFRLVRRDGRGLCRGGCDAAVLVGRWCCAAIRPAAVFDACRGELTLSITRGLFFEGTALVRVLGMYTHRPLDRWVHGCGLFLPLPLVLRGRRLLTHWMSPQGSPTLCYFLPSRHCHQEILQIQETTS